MPSAACRGDSLLIDDSPFVSVLCAAQPCLQWPAEALVSVAHMQMEKSDVVVQSYEQVLNVLQAMHSGVQSTAARYREELGRTMYATPTTFLEMLSAFLQLVQAKQVDLVTIQDRFEKGLGKLEETSKQVAAMQAQLQELQPVLQATSEEVGLLWIAKQLA